MTTSLKTTSGAFYVVATPIGNLEDISRRALQCLREVSHVLAEDTRHTQGLLSHYQITTSLVPLHRFNEATATEWVIQKLVAGESLALVSDAGTPVISDPGARIIKQLQSQCLPVIPIPGACAAIAALSVSGLEGDRFVFEGFLPNKREARKNRLARLYGETRTLIFYEAPHRILATLDDMITVFGPNHQAVLARELTKQFETVKMGDLAALKAFTEQDSYGQKGEFVVLISGWKRLDEQALTLSLTDCLKPLLTELPLKKAVQVAVTMTNLPRNVVYQQALLMKDQGGENHE